jgi:hypothetical protein
MLGWVHSVCSRFCDSGRAAEWARSLGPEATYAPLGRTVARRHWNHLAVVFWVWMKASIAALRPATEVKLAPLRMLRVRIENQISTWLSQLGRVDVKRKGTFLCRASN